MTNLSIHRPPLHVAKGDLNHNKKLDPAEKSRMQVLDGNRDGIVDRKEHGRELKLFDKNHNGKIGPMERHQEFNKTSKSVGDFDHNGKIGPAERNAVKNYDRNGDHKIGPLENIKQLLDWDKNQDGRIGPMERGKEIQAFSMMA